MKRVALLLLLLAACAAPAKPARSGEWRLANLRQLTFDGTNAEAYWSPDGTRLVYQAVKAGDRADQVYVLDLATGASRKISDGKGKCTCAYFLPDGRIVYSSTKHAGDAPPPPPDRSKGYVWPLYRDFEIYVLDPATGKEKRITESDGYDAETTVSPDGTRLVFMSQRDGAFGLYTMNPDGTGLAKVTRRRCYTGGAFFSPDGTRLVYRAFFPSGPEQEKQLDRMLAERALIPFPGMVIEIQECNADGSGERAVTATGRINFAPAWHPDGRRIIYTSDAKATTRGGYQLFLVDRGGGAPEQVSFHAGFDGFPMFSPDGRRLVFISDRNAKSRHDLNLFIADWVE